MDVTVDPALVVTAITVLAASEGLRIYRRWRASRFVPSPRPKIPPEVRPVGFIRGAAKDVTCGICGDFVRTYFVLSDGVVRCPQCQEKRHG